MDEIICLKVDFVVATYSKNVNTGQGSNAKSIKPKLTFNIEIQCYKRIRTNDIVKIQCMKHELWYNKKNLSLTFPLTTDILHFLYSIIYMIRAEGLKDKNLHRETAVSVQRPENSSQK